MLLTILTKKATPATTINRLLHQTYNVTKHTNYHKLRHDQEPKKIHMAFLLKKYQHYTPKVSARHIYDN